LAILLAFGVDSRFLHVHVVYEDIAEGVREDELDNTRVMIWVLLWYRRSSKQTDLGAYDQHVVLRHRERYRIRNRGQVVKIAEDAACPEVVNIGLADIERSITIICSPRGSQWFEAGVDAVLTGYSRNFADKPIEGLRTYL
jgi:hypothetical protein